MKRSVCLLLGAIYGVLLFTLMVIDVEKGEAYYTAIHGAVFAAAMMACCGYLFNAKPAASASGILFSALALLEPQSWYLFIVPCLLVFAGWSNIRDEEMDVMAYIMEETVKMIMPENQESGR